MDKFILDGRRGLTDASTDLTVHHRELRRQDEGLSLGEVQGIFHLTLVMLGVSVLVLYYYYYILLYTKALVLTRRFCTYYIIMQSAHITGVPG